MLEEGIVEELKWGEVYKTLQLTYNLLFNVEATIEPSNYAWVGQTAPTDDSTNKAANYLVMLEEGVIE